MARQKAIDWIPTYNNIAKRKGVPQIPLDAKMSLAEIADKLDWVNRLRDIGAPKPKQSKTQITVGIVHKINELFGKHVGIKIF